MNYRLNQRDYLKTLVFSYCFSTAHNSPVRKKSNCNVNAVTDSPPPQEAVELFNISSIDDRLTCWE